MNEKQYRAKEFAIKAGVTVRTLHFYDQAGLLPPAARTESGYRLYGEAELERLEHISALRFVGFGLDHIKKLLAGPAMPLIVALRMQRQIMAQQKRQLDAALAAIDAAELALTSDASADRWRTLHDVIEVFKVKNDWSWTDNYYTDEDRAKLAQRMKDTPKEVIEKGQRDWAELIAEVETAAAQGIDPASEQAKSLGKRWQDLIAQFTQGDAGIYKGLSKLWSDPTHWPQDFKKPYSDQAEAFIHRVMRCE